MRRGARRAALALAALVPAGAWSGAARADDTLPKTPAALPVRAAQVVLEKGVVKISVSFRDAIDADIASKLQSHLFVVVTMRSYLFSSSGGPPIALTAKSCRINKDLWEDEVYEIQLVQPGGPQSVVAINQEGVARNCFEARKLPLVDRKLLTSGVSYLVATIVEVNPVSQATLDRIKLWITRPTGSSGIGPGDALFGSFVGLFVARIPDADRRLAFRSAAFLPPDPPP